MDEVIDNMVEVEVSKVIDGVSISYKITVNFEMMKELGHKFEIPKKYID